MASTAAAVPPTQNRQLIASLIGGLILGFTDVIFTISLASLVFSGGLRDQLSRGIAIMLVTEVITTVVAAVWMAKRGTMVTIQQNPAVILAVTAPGLVAAVSAGGNVIATFVAFIVVTTVLTGLFLVFLGTFRLGGLVRYIPYPVIGGFLAGVGWLLLVGAMNTMSDNPLSLATFSAFFSPQQLPLWLPGVIFALVLFFGNRISENVLTFPILFVTGAVVFYIVLALTGIPLQEALRQGLLLGDVGSIALWRPLPLQDIGQADWGAIVGQVGNIGSIIAITAVELLLNVSGIELLLHKDIDLNYQLRTAGFMNILSGLAGGTIGYSDLSFSTLNRRVGGNGRLTSLITTTICLLLLVAGVSFLAYVPKALIGGLLFYQGLGFLNQWVIEGRKKLSRTDYAVVVLIWLMVALYGFLQGVALGLILTIIIFVVDYSRINIFRNVLNGAEISSRVERNAYYERALADLGKSIYVLELQNFIFFGTANTVLEQIHKRLAADGEPPLKYLLLDFRRVTGMDSSAAFSLMKTKYLAEANGFIMLFTRLSAAFQHELARNGLLEDDTLKVFPDLDHGLEWCEDRLLEIERITAMHLPVLLYLQLEPLGFPRKDTARLQKYMERQSFLPGETIIRQGDESTDLYFIEMGEVSLYLDVDSTTRVRLNTLALGTTVGELGFILNKPRTASVVANLNTVMYRLTRQSMQDMKTNEPDLAVNFNEMLLRVISERLISNIDELAALHR